MGTVVGFTSPAELPPEGLAGALAALHEADRLFSTWDPESPLSLIRGGALSLAELEAGQQELFEDVIVSCQLARQLTEGAFDPWAMPGGLDPTGFVKGWAVDRAVAELAAAGVSQLLVNAGGDIRVLGRNGKEPWRVGLRHSGQPGFLSAVIEVSGAVATSGNYERPGELFDPVSKKAAGGISSATVTGPQLGLSDALATALAVRGRPVLERIDALEGFEGHLVTSEGRHLATAGMAFVH